MWRIDALRRGFCIQLLLEPSRLDLSLPPATRLLRADAIQDLSPVLRSLITSETEYAGWTPSNICLYFMQTVDVGPFRLNQRSPERAPMVGAWTLAATDGSGGPRRDVAIRFFTNHGRLERAAEVSGLRLREARCTVELIPDEEDPTAPPVGVRYELKLGKMVLIWEGREVKDSARADAPLVTEWQVEGRRGTPMTARLRLTPQWTRAMAGSLRVEGNDRMSQAVKASPIRFVGPAMVGGNGELAYGR